MRKPSPALVVAIIALVAALGGTAYAASTIVNIGDPTNPAHVAAVTAGGKLEVGDGSGPLTVDGTVTAEPPASTLFHQTNLTLQSFTGCQPIATPPAGKALIVREVRVDVYADPSPGTDQGVAIYNGSGCTGPKVVGDVNPPTVGHTVIPFDPGLGVPAGSRLRASVTGQVAAESYVDGYTVPASEVPSSGVHGDASPSANHRR